MQTVVTFTHDGLGGVRNGKNKDDILARKSDSRLDYGISILAGGKEACYIS